MATLDVIFGEKENAPREVVLSDAQEKLSVTVKDRAQAQLFVRTDSTKATIEVTVGAEASLEIVVLSSNGSSMLRSHVGTGGTVHWHCTTLGGAGSSHDLVSTLTGANATSSVDWIFRVKGKEKQSVSVRNVFAAREGGGEITMKGVAEDKGHAVCNGMIEITEQGTGTNTYLTENVLMLDATAHTDAIPGLEIRTNDVKASHSATISRVTAEDLFYLQSRGIDALTARAMFVEGFLGDLTERITQPSVREIISHALAGTI